MLIRRKKALVGRWTGMRFSLRMDVFNWLIGMFGVLWLAFYGKCVERDGYTEITGRFKLTPYAKAFLGVFFGIFAYVLYIYISTAGPVGEWIGAYLSDLLAMSALWGLVIAVPFFLIAYPNQFLVLRFIWKELEAVPVSGNGQEEPITGKDGGEKWPYVDDISGYWIWGRKKKQINPEAD